MNFGEEVKRTLINEVQDVFPSLQMHPEFSLLSPKTQVLIARKRLWSLLRGFNAKDRSVLLNEIGYGFVTIFEGQSAFEFEYNNSEERYIKSQEAR